MCCAIAALLIGVMAMWRRGLAVARHWRPQLRLAAVSAATAIALIAGSALAAQHFDHYATRAQAGGRTLLAEILAQPICRGGSSDDRADADVSHPDRTN
jgi:hypothetical protein